MILSDLNQFRKGDDISKLDMLPFVPSTSFTFDNIKNMGKVDVIVYPAFLMSGDIKMIYYYFFAFNNEKLVFWGYPDDFLKNDDEAIRQIGENTVTKAEFNTGG